MKYLKYNFLKKKKKNHKYNNIYTKSNVTYEGKKQLNTYIIFYMLIKYFV